MTRPLSLPKFVFLMANTPESSKLAVSVAEHMSTLDHTVFIDDFTAPIYEAFRTMWDKDYRTDYGSAKTTQALMLEAIETDATEADCIASLANWFAATFGPQQLGRMGHRRALDQQAITEYIYVFRDATPDHMSAFVLNRHLDHKRDMLVVWLHSPVPNSFPCPQVYLNTPIPTDVAQIVSDMEEESR